MLCGMHHNGDLTQGQAVQPHGLNDLQPLIHQCGAINGDFRPHGPIRMPQSTSTGLYAASSRFLPRNSVRRSRSIQRLCSLRSAQPCKH